MSESTSTPAIGLLDPALLDRYRKVLDQPLPDVQPDTTPARGGLFTRIVSALGEFAGSPDPETLKALSPQERQDAGLTALSRFGTGLLQASGSGQWIGSNLGHAFATAERGYDQIGRKAVGNLAARQGYAVQQQQDQLARIKEALPLLTLQQRLAATAGFRDPLAGSGSGGGGGDGSFLSALADIESGDKNIVSGTDKDSQGLTLAQGGNASEISQGHFQIQTATWKDFAGKAGVDIAQYPTAMSAPREVQARVAAVIPLSRFGPRTQELLRTRFGPLDTNQTVGALAGTPALTFTPGTAGPRLAAGGGAPAPPGAQVAIPPPVQVAGPGAASAPGAVAPAPLPLPTLPPPTPLGPLDAASREEYRAAHPFAPSPEQARTFTTDVDPRIETSMSLQETNAKNLVQQLTQQYQATGDVKLLADISTATDKYNSVVSANNTLRQKQIEMGHTSYNTALQAHQKSLDESYDKARELKQTADAEAARAAQAQGATLIEKRQADDMSAGRKVTDAMDTAAGKAHQMNAGLMQMYPFLSKLPQGGLGALLQAKPDLLGPLKTAGVISPDTADAVQLITGLTSYMATEMKPAGLGSMREYEFDAFRAALPNLLKSPEGQKTAMAMLLNMNDRIQTEAQWMRGHFGREIADPSAPGGRRGAYNLAADNTTQMDKALGPVIPHYTGDPSDATALAAYRQKQLPGRPYKDLGFMPGPDGKPLRDASGNPRMREYLKVAPMPGDQ